MLEVKILDYEHLPEELKEDADGWGYKRFVVVTHNGKVLEWHSDGMEPEDCTFGRDLRWVPILIRKAYELGLEDGKQ